jgi:Protein of unknown function (DUF3995)
MSLTLSIGFVLALIFLTLAAIHVYWACGGTWGKSAAIPTIASRRTINPGTAATLTVALLLSLASFVVIGRTGLAGNALPFAFFYWSVWALSLVFLLRAVGDFHLFGFFKTVTGTPFAFHDTRLFSPLCLLISALSTILNLS